VNSQFETLARNLAVKHGLNDALVCAVIEQESSWNPAAKRYEPAFYTHYIRPLMMSMGLTQEEATNRATSWGLMQIMGEVARELGYTDALPDLCDPATGIEWGCRKLAQCMVRANADAYRALQFWNGGGNPNYAPQVIARMDKYIEELVSNAEEVQDAAAGEVG
jgi:soluble lytic murein transglycosylase-like protein